MADEGKLELLNPAGRAWLLALLWTAAVLLAGGDHASADTTSRFIRPFLEWLLPDAAPETVGQIHYLIRKSAHVDYHSSCSWASLSVSSLATQPLRTHAPNCRHKLDTSKHFSRCLMRQKKESAKISTDLMLILP